MNPRLFYLGLVLLLGASASADTSRPVETALKPLGDMSLVELERREICQDGRRLSFVRIRPPQFPPREIVVPPPQTEPDAETLAAEARREAKTHHNILLTGGAYVGEAGAPGGTELHLFARDGAHPRRARVFVPVDLRLVDQVMTLETSDRVYVYTVLLSVSELAWLRKTEWPPELQTAAGAPSAFAGDPPDYVFEGSPEDEQAFDETLAGLEVLLAHLSLHREPLVEALAQRLALNAELTREAERKAAEPPPHRTVYFWKIETPAARR